MDAQQAEIPREKYRVPVLISHDTNASVPPILAQPLLATIDRGFWLPIELITRLSLQRQSRTVSTRWGDCELWSGVLLDFVDDEGALSPPTNQRHRGLGLVEHRQKGGGSLVSEG